MPLALALLALAADGPVETVWLEGEVATVAGPLEVGGRGGYLSGGKWLTATGPIPVGGATATWPFAAPAAGRYDVWARVGFAGDFAPFRWRVDGRVWVDVPSSTPPHDLGATDDGTLVGWVKAGTIDLAGGRHTLELHVPGGPPRFAIDAVCLIDGRFYPDGPNRPGTVNRSALDWQAASRPFEFPPVPHGNPPHTRQVLELAGVWQAARWDELEVADRAAAISELPADLDARPWHGARVPGELADARPEWAYCHRYLLRTRFLMPADAGSRSVTLRLPNTALLATVFVNGRRVGTTVGPHCPLVCDLGATVRPGLNELVVAVKDSYYAVAGVPWAKLRLLPPSRFAASELTRTLDWPVRTTRRGGLLEAPTLTLAGPVAVADVFTRPQVAAGRLALDVTVRNHTDSPRTVDVRPEVRPTEPDGRVVGGIPAKPFAQKLVPVPAGGEATVTFDEPWPNPRPWWPDDPVRYTVETTLRLDGRPVDEQSTRFGFREWSTAGTRVSLNGVPWKLSADGRHGGPLSGAVARQAVKDWRASGVSAFRYAAERPWTGPSLEEALGFLDAAGVPVLRALPGDDGTPANRLTLFLARVRTERNHPAVAAWELPPGADPAAVRGVDPTRPVLSVGDEDGVVDRPLILVHAITRPPAEATAGVGGAALAAGRLVADRQTRQLAESDRWRQVAVSRFDGPGPTTGWQPVAMLVKEPETTVPAGRPLTRTLRLFNDTRSGSPITVHWLFRVKGRPGEIRGKRVVKLAPGGSEQFPLILALPAGDRLEAELVLSCERDGREVFRDVRPLTLVGP